MKMAVLVALIFLIHSGDTAMANYQAQAANRNVEPKTVSDSNSGLEWQVKEPGKKTWNRADKYCKNVKIAGKTDWRLPTLEELESLIEYLKSNPAVRKNDFGHIRSTYYWASSSSDNNTDRAWLMFFYSGQVKFLYKSSNAYMRCVRSEQQNGDRPAVIYTLLDVTDKVPVKVNV